MHLNRASLVVAPVLIGLLFASTLVGIDRLAFRDVSHFYTPLYDYVGQRTGTSWLPLWNPLDQTGIPLAGETTTAVFYPVRYLLYALPMSSEAAIAWYVALHLILSSVTARQCARWCGVSRYSATVAGVIYPLSGSVLFLHTNPPFLVGAAWLPLVLGSMLGRRRMGVSARLQIAGSALAMMVLGGDPQTAVHAMIVVSLVCAARQFGRNRQDNRAMLCSVLLLPLVVVLLAAPQVAASISWSRQSDRLQHDRQGSWIDPPQVGSRRHDAYQYSLPPWHALEIVTPNPSGSVLPVNRRISRLIPGDGRMWTPSIYVGMLAAIALSCRFFSSRPQRHDVWSGMAVASLLLSFGQFGAAWLVQSTTGLMADADSAIGGPYWLLYQFMPGYDVFRYPTKWLPLFSLATAIITARWLDCGAWREPIAVKRVITVLLVTLVVTSLAIAGWRWNPPGFLSATKPGLPLDAYWGPLDVTGGLVQLQRSLVHSMLFLSLVAVVFQVRKSFGISRRRTQLILLVMVSVDLAICGRSLIPRVPVHQEQTLAGEVWRKNGQAEDRDVGRWMRTQHDGGWPQAWRQAGDPQRLLDVSTSERLAWFGRWHLARRQAVLNNMTSIQSQSMTMFWQAADRVTEEMTLTESDKFWRSVRRWLAIDGIVHTSSRVIQVNLDGRTAQLVDVQHLFDAKPPIEFREQWRRLPEGTPSVDSFFDLLQEVHAGNGQSIPSVTLARNVPIGPMIRRESGVTLPTDADAATEPSHALKVLVDRPELTEIDVKTERPGWLIRPTYQDGNWLAEVRAIEGTQWQRVPVQSVDFLKQGAWIPEGHWKLRFRYRPSWFIWSTAAAALAWILLAVCVMAKANRKF